LYNSTPGDNFTPGSHRLSSKQAAEQFFQNPQVREFPNIILYRRATGFAELVRRIFVAMQGGKTQQCFGSCKF
jgi:hypothetical protein